MSTRALIGFGTLDRFDATYHHFDGYPLRTGLAVQQHLVPLPGETFEDARARFRDYIDEHPAGWRDLTEAECFCHRPDGSATEDSPWNLNERSGAAGADWFYLIGEDDLTVYRRLGGEWIEVATETLFLLDESFMEAAEIRGQRDRLW
jgi:hypothetical protein